MTDHTCQYEDQIHTHSIQIKGLETHAGFKNKRIDEINNKIDKMEKKLDELNENVNKLVLQSKQEDQQIEIRLTRIETEMEQNKVEQQQRLVWIGLILTTITLLINLYFRLVP